jgi:hypothetical protein
VATRQTAGGLDDDPQRPDRNGNHGFLVQGLGVLELVGSCRASSSPHRSWAVAVSHEYLVELWAALSLRAELCEACVAVGDEVAEVLGGEGGGGECSWASRILR